VTPQVLSRGGNLQIWEGRRTREGQWDSFSLAARGSSGVSLIGRDADIDRLSVGNQRIFTTFKGVLDFWTQRGTCLQSFWR